MHDDDVVVCRCEEITKREILAAIDDGAVDIAGVKRRTRAGMGVCQGRTCEAIIARILAHQLGVPAADIAPDTVRPPTACVSLGDLAGENDGA